MNADLSGLNAFAGRAREASRMRGMDGTAEEYLKHCAGEVVEAVSEYNNWTISQDEGGRERFALELADVIMCALLAADAEGVDIEKALAVCLGKNIRRGCTGTGGYVTGEV